MSDCSKCIHIDVCGKLVFFGRNCNRECIHYKDGSNLKEIVRCSDCVHWYEPEAVCLKIYSDGAVSPYAWQDRNADDFCSYGEMTENG